MPFTVITLKSVPSSLRGDLSKWMQEISPGVYIGNFNSRIREKLWQRVKENVGTGDATISFYSTNELGYDFKTHNTNRKVINFDGIPLVLIEKSVEDCNFNKKFGYSNASKIHKTKKYLNKSKNEFKRQVIFIDIETSGLDENSARILEIGAVKSRSKEEFSRIIYSDIELSREISNLTGITMDIVEEGDDVTKVLQDFLDFVADHDLIGYNVNFDLAFINRSLMDNAYNSLNNRTYDLLHFVKKEKKFLENYKMQTVLNAYGIKKEQKHRALDDAKLCLELARKVNKFVTFINNK